jgi:hypothetical protein
MQRVALFLEVEYQERMLEGPVYNPRYPENGMNKEKVNRSKKEQIDFNIAERFPAAERQYLDLLRLCDRAAVAELRRVRHG